MVRSILSEAVGGEIKTDAAMVRQTPALTYIGAIVNMRTPAIY